jgi:hypothetical protein
MVRTLTIDKRSPRVKVNLSMPNRRPTALSTKPAGKASLPPRANFRHRYDDLESRRSELVARLALISSGSQQHPGYKRALTLLNDTFRKSKLAQRLAVLQAASWLIDILEQLTSLV